MAQVTEPIILDSTGQDIVTKLDGIVRALNPPVLITKTITQNGTYNASSDEADGYSSVTVEVQPVSLSQSEYNALSEAEKNNGSVYRVTEETNLINTVSTWQTNITCSSYYGTDQSGAVAPYKGAWHVFNGTVWDGNGNRDEIGWSPNGNGVEGWVQYDFSSDVQITEVKISVFGRNNAWSGTVYIDVSDDGTNWENLTSFNAEAPKYTNNTSNEYTAAINDSTKYKYIRARATQANGNSFCLGEMYVKGFNDSSFSLYYMSDKYVLD